jgi:putative thioredoxin
MPTSVFDVDQDRFQQEVIDASHEVPVVVDFWAAWCGPCKVLGPALEAAVDARGGTVRLAKVDVDANPQLASTYRIQGIPAVKAFRDGAVVAEFTGAVGPPQIEAFLDQVVPSEADRAAATGAALADRDPDAARDAYRRALDLDPGHRQAAIGLAGLVVDDDPETALTLVKPHRPDPDAEAVVTRAELAASGGDLDTLQAAVEADPDDADARVALGRALAADGRHAEAFDHLLAAVAAGGDARETAREQLVALFGLLGDDDPLVRETRPKLARALF